MEDNIQEYTSLVKINKEEDTTEVFKVEIDYFLEKDFKLGLFGEVIDVRTPEAFSKDRIYGAVKYPI